MFFFLSKTVKVNFMPISAILRYPIQLLCRERNKQTNQLAFLKHVMLWVVSNKIRTLWLGAELFDLVRDKRFRIPLMSVVFWHLLKDKPWGDVVTGNKFSDLVNESFMEYKNTVRKESEGSAYLFLL